MNNLWNDLENKEASIAVVGLGYVGLPLACLLATKFKVVGFDINKSRISELCDGIDRTNEITDSETLKNSNLNFTSNPEELSKTKFIVVAVPTPIDSFKKPDLGPLLGASKTVGQNMSKGTVVVYESTVFPGVTEDYCKTTLETNSKLKHGTDFFLGYSPERVNPGDKEHTIDKIIKVVSGSNNDIAELLNKVYGSVITAGIHMAPSIATAEAAKVIENTQRDLNIALINELSQIFSKIDLDTIDVLKAAGTKWNFLNFRPGLVGGHCIGVDPYYLTHLAQGVGVNPQVILAGRKINDDMGKFIATETIKQILRIKSSKLENITVGVLGVTFKENVPDLRNSKVIDVITELEEFGVKTYSVDPEANPDDYYKEYGRKLTPWDDLPKCDAVVVAVPHKSFLRKGMLEEILSKINMESKVIIDIKCIFDRNEAKELGVNLWRL